MDKAAQDLLATLTRRRELRDGNHKPSRPDEATLSSLDSSMKRNNAVIRRIRTLNDDSKAAVLEDIARTNQSKYVAEAANALVEAVQRPRDVSAAAEVASVLHRRYADLNTVLESALGRELANQLTEERAALLRKRALLRFAVELIVVGVVPPSALSLLGSEVRQLRGRVAEGADASAMSLLSSLAKAGRQELLGLGLAGLELTTQGEKQTDQASGSITLLKEEIDRAWQAPAAFRQQLMTSLQDTLDTATGRLRRERSALARTEARNARNLTQRGDLSEATVRSYEERRAACEAWSSACVSLAEGLGLDSSELVIASVEDTEDEAAEGKTLLSEQPEATSSPFEDEETRAFYEDLLDLFAIVPGVLLGGRSAADVEATARAVEEAAASVVEQQEQGPPEKTSVDDDQQTANPISSNKVTTPQPGGMQEILDRLPSCVSREDADDIALRFCHVSTKSSRRRLAQELCEVPTGALALLPFFARIAATLGRVWAEIPATLVANLQAESGRQRRYKDVTGAGRATEARIRNARYVAELLKFGVFPPGPAFSTLRALLDDFAGNSIDAACALVDGAGRYLVRRPDTRERMEAMLAVMLRLAEVKRLDARQSALVAAAASAVRSGPTAAAKRKERPPIHAFIRHVIYSSLSTTQKAEKEQHTAPICSSADGMVKKSRRAKKDKPDANQTPAAQALTTLRKIPCDAINEAYVRKTLARAAVKAPAGSVGVLASLSAGLARYHPSLGVGLVDDLLESVAQGLEQPDSLSFQERLATIKLLGECYNYRIANSHVIFATLETLLQVDNDNGSSNMSSSVDPPTNYFRVRLACAMLSSCGTFFTRGANRPRLDLALARLRAYSMTKNQPLPLEIALDLQDVQTALGVQLPSFDDLEAAREAVQKLAAEETARLLEEQASSYKSGPGLDEEVVQEEEEGDREEQEEEDGVSTTKDEQGTSTPDEEEEDESEGDSGDDDEESVDDEEEEEEDGDAMEVDVTQQEEIDEQFERDLESMLQGTKKSYLLSGTGSSIKHRSHLFAPPGRAGAAPSSTSASGGNAVPVAFSVMVRRGAKPEPAKLLRKLSIPVAPRVENRIRAREAAEKAERNEIKRFVLAADRRSAEEENETVLWQGRHRARGGSRQVSFQGT